MERVRSACLRKQTRSSKPLAARVCAHSRKRAREHRAARVAHEHGGERVPSTNAGMIIGREVGLEVLERLT